ncbi:MAG: DUF4367 domain-containing protein [Dehalococcoidales bacterium]|nr:DUF4367 domain-containing protein [Dehalococcoidales bacterium]
MKTQCIKWVLITVLLTTHLTVVSCSDNDADMDVRVLSSAEEASKIIGLPLPMPEYLPEGYEVRSVEVEGDAVHGNWDVSVLINDSEDPGSSNNISMVIHWFYPGIKLIDVEKVAVGESKAIVFREPDYTTLLWLDQESRTMRLRGNVTLEFDELVKIAESITVPPREVLDVSIEPDYDMVIPRGSSKEFTLYVHNNAIEPIKISLDSNDELPKEIKVNLEEDSFSLQPEESRGINVYVEVEDDAPSPIRPEPGDNENLPEELQDSPHPIIDEMYYRLTIVCNYEIFENKPHPKRASVRFRIDPQDLPPGMVTFREAVAAADFPLSPLLPTYLPEGTESLPIGYEIGDKRPYCITAVYNNLRVGLCPKTGIMEPPPEEVGERTFIHEIPAIIRENRIDWWSCDIHFSLVSDEISIDGLKEIAESMLQFTPFSGSWLDR